MTGAAGSQADPAEIGRAFDLLVEPGGVVEIRALKVDGTKRTDSGYFNSREQFVSDAVALSGSAPGVYFTLNRIDPALLARCNNRIKRWASTTTADNNVTRLQWIPFDLDPERPAGISSTDAQHDMALSLALKLARWLTHQGVPEQSIVSADSGNGAHVLLRVDLPADHESHELVKNVLLAAAFAVDTEHVHVDQSVHNAGRILKIPGTLAAKGDHTPDRPHRLSRLLDPPERESLEVCPLAVLTNIASKLPASEPQQRSRRSGFHDVTGEWTLEQWLIKYDVEVGDPSPWQSGTKWVFAVCPWNPDHNDGSAYIVRFASGALGAGCHHNGCTDKDWRALRVLFEPDAYSESKIANDIEGAPPSEMAIFDSVGHLRPNLVRLSDVKTEQIRWLWPGRIALGKITLLDGDPGQLKSTITLDLAARITTGALMPDGTLGIQGGVVLVTYEDGLGDTVRPRLEAAQADLTQVVALQGVGLGNDTRLASIPDDLHAIREAASTVGAVLVVIDPLMAALSSSVNSHHDQDVRRALAPLARLAEELSVAVLVVRHLNKGQGASAMYRGGGSIGITGAARSVLLAATDPDDKSGHVLAVVKSNLSAAAAAIRYRAVEAGNGMARIEWLGRSERTADELVGPPEDQSALAQAVEFLRELLADGPVLGNDVTAAASAEGIAEKTLARAKKFLGIKPTKRKTKDGGWEWQLPEDGQASRRWPSQQEGPLRPDVAIFEESELADQAVVPVPRNLTLPEYIASLQPPHAE